MLERYKGLVTAAGGKIQFLMPGEAAGADYILPAIPDLEELLLE